MMRNASLPMYVVPAASLASFWAGLRTHLRREGVADAPDRLFVPDDLYAHWLSPTLLFSQTCGYPLTDRLTGRVQYVGTPCFQAPGCEGPFYSSVVLVRASDRAAVLADTRGSVVAFNSRDSQSGFNALRALVAPLADGGRFFAAAVETGSHRASIAALRNGTADVAAVDAVTFALLDLSEPDAVRGLRVLASTDQVPGLPVITAVGTKADDLARLRAAWTAACTDPALAVVRGPMLLSGFAVLPLTAYATIPAMRQGAVDLGYPDLD